MVGKSSLTVIRERLFAGVMTWPQYRDLLESWTCKDSFSVNSADVEGHAYIGYLSCDEESGRFSGVLYGEYDIELYMGPLNNLISHPEDKGKLLYSIYSEVAYSLKEDLLEYLTGRGFKGERILFLHGLTADIELHKDEDGDESLGSLLIRERVYGGEKGIS